MGLPHTRRPALLWPRHTPPLSRAPSWVCFQVRNRPTVGGWRLRSCHGGPQPAEGRPRESAQPGCAPGPATLLLGRSPARVNEIPHHPPSEWGHQATWGWTLGWRHHTRMPPRPALCPAPKERHARSRRPGPRGGRGGKANASQLSLGRRPRSQPVFPGSQGLGPGPHTAQRHPRDWGAAVPSGCWSSICLRSPESR